MKKQSFFCLITLVFISITQIVLASSIYDNFDDSSVDHNKWFTQGDSFLSESSGVLNVNLNSKPVTSRDVAIRSKVWFDGNFDISVQYKDLLIGKDYSSTNNNATLLQLQLQERTSPLNQTPAPTHSYVFRGWSPPSGDMYYTNYIENGVLQDHNNPIQTNDTSGYLRVTRIGSTIETYRADSSKQWVKLDTYTDAFTGPADITLFSRVENNTNSFHVELDNVNIKADKMLASKPDAPVILVHGINILNQDAASYWGPTIDYFNKIGWQCGGTIDVNINGELLSDVYTSGTIQKGDYYLVNFNPYYDAIEQQGAGLRDAIDQIKITASSDKVTLVGHSMGGLASREVLGPDIESFISIGTPYRGAPAATLRNIIPNSSAYRDLSTGSVFLEGGNENNDDVNCNGVTNENISGQLRELPIGGIDPDQITSIVEDVWYRTHGMTSGDGIVSVDSQYFQYKIDRMQPDGTTIPQYIKIGNVINSDYDHILQAYDYASIMKALGYPSPLVFNSHSPIDLIVTDPDGNYISKDGSTIWNGLYSEFDWDGDGELESQIAIPFFQNGAYSVRVLPKAGYDPTETFSLSALYGGERRYLAENIMLQDIPEQAYMLDTTVPEPASLSLLGAGLLGLFFRRKKKLK